jgi:hypothetical protein
MFRNHRPVRKAFSHNCGPKMARPTLIASMASVQVRLIMNGEFAGLERSQAFL